MQKHSWIPELWAWTCCWAMWEKASQGCISVTDPALSRRLFWRFLRSLPNWILLWSYDPLWGVKRSLHEQAMVSWMEKEKSLSMDQKQLNLPILELAAGGKCQFVGSELPATAEMGTSAKAFLTPWEESKRALLSPNSHCKLLVWKAGLEDRTCCVRMQRTESSLLNLFLFDLSG